MTIHNFSLLFIAAGLLSGCAAMIPELTSARNAYEEARTGPAANLVPADLHKAHEALEIAEKAYEDDPRGYHTKDLAYVAQRKAELAEALAAQVTARNNAAAANSQYQTTQDAIMLNTKAALGASQSDLAASQTAHATSAAQLSASQDALAIAEQRTREAMSALEKLAAVKEEARGLVITLSGSVLFRSDESTLLPSAQTKLGQVATALMASKERSIIVEGHTDSQGSDAHNLELSQRRAEAVRTFLTGQGYDPSKIRAVGIGEARPIAENESAEGRANNRRVELVVQPGPTAK